MAHGNGQAEGCDVPPWGGGGVTPRKWTSGGPIAAVREGAPTAGMGVSAWTPLATGEGRGPPPCGPDTGQWNRDSPGAPLAERPEGKEREVEREG